MTNNDTSKTTKHRRLDQIAEVLYPIENCTRLCFLKNIITNPKIIVGDYTYYDDPEDVRNFEKNVLYLFDFIEDNLIIGKFCQIATNARFIMNGANHSMSGISTYPFKVIDKSRRKTSMDVTSKGSTIIGNDVWIGNSATIMPGIKVSHGAIIGASSVVTKNVEPYSIVAGNPAKLIRKRFSDEIIKFLLNLAWWDWSIEKITENIEAITTANFLTLKSLMNN